MSRSAHSTKLIPTLLGKSNLRFFYLEHDLALIDVHRVLRFQESRLLAAYIEKNSSLWAAAKNYFEKEIFKSTLITSEQNCKKLVEKPLCMAFKIIYDELLGVEMRKIKTLFNKRFYLGFSGLELSKLHMYLFHYDYFRKKYAAAKMLLLHTDSLIYWV